MAEEMDPADQPTLKLIRDFFPPESRRKRSVRSLVSILMNFIEATDLSARLDAFVDLRDWVRTRSPSPVGKGVTRMETFLELMESHRALRVLFQEGIREILTEVRSVELFAEGALHPREGLWTVAVRRLVEELLPSTRTDTDLSKLVFRLYPTRNTIERLLSL